MQGLNHLPISTAFTGEACLHCCICTNGPSNSCSGRGVAGGKNKAAVATNLLRCSRCQSARYCSPACQRADWSDHKGECHLLQGFRKEYPRFLSAPVRWKKDPPTLAPEKFHVQLHWGKPVSFLWHRDNRRINALESLPFYPNFAPFVERANMLATTMELPTCGSIAQPATLVGAVVRNISTNTTVTRTLNTTYAVALFNASRLNAFAGSISRNMASLLRLCPSRQRSSLPWLRFRAIGTRFLGYAAAISLWIDFLPNFFPLPL